MDHETGRSWPAQAWLVCRKDLRIEASTGEVLTTSCFFALLVVVISSLSFYGGPRAKVMVAPGVIWVAIAFASVLALGRGWAREREFGALEGTLLLPLRPSAVFAGKALSLASIIGVIEAMVIPVTALLFNLSFAEHLGGLIVFAVVATPGIAAAGTLFCAMTAKTTARDLVLAVVLFPLLAPTLLAAVAGTRELLEGVPLAELSDYFALMGLFGLLFTAGGLGLFGLLIDG